jgi:chemotaxis protein methyltransferase WspC
VPPDLRPFVRLLEERIGLDAASIGHDEVGRAVRRRTETLAGRHGPGASPWSLRDYYRHLLDDPEEWDEFVEHVLVPETWFFREPTAFELLTRIVPERLRTAPRCRVLSVPCATGEEPYSMAMALRDAGVVDRVTIDASDISQRVLKAAAGAVYGSRAVRYVGSERLAKHFIREADGHRLADDIKDLVSFKRGNLVDEQVLATRRHYDVIFCRNVLIYLTPAARQRVLATLSAALADDGWLVTGHAEVSGVVAPRFVSARVPRTFAYRKAPADAAASDGAGRHAGGALPRSLDTPKASGPQALPAVRGPGARAIPAAPVTPPGAGPPRAPSLREIERVADAGDLGRAAALCRAYLAGSPGSSQGYYLLGVVESARGQRDAADAALRRAIYLDPGHVAALQHLANERRRHGDEREAAQLSRRAGLVQARQK